MTKRISLAVALSAFVVACADPSGPSVGRTLIGDASAALIPHPLGAGGSFPSSNGIFAPTAGNGDGWVRLCKVSNVAGSFQFDVAVNGAVNGTPDVTIVVAANQLNQPVCHTSPLHNSDLAASLVDEVNIVELNPGANWATVIDIDQWFFSSGVSYHANALLDQWNVTPRTAKVFINDDMEKLVTFRNTFTNPQAPICDFITFGRLVWESGDQKVVISGNAGGLNADGSIKGEFHIEVNDVDHHVHDVTTYGPIAAAPLASATYTNSRRVTGTDIHGHSVELRLWDGGEPGWKFDRFWFNVNGTIVGNATTGNLIDQGNMQYHPNCRGPGDE